MVEEASVGIDPTKERNGKYNNVPTKNVLGSFDSKSEANHADYLHQLERQGYIRNLNLEKWKLRYPLEVNSLLVATYEGDASFICCKYFEIETKFGPMLLKEGQEIVADVKGKRTPDYVIKKKLMWACRGIDVVEL